MAEFAPVVAPLKRVLIKASKMLGTSPHPDTVNEGAGMASGAFTSPCMDESSLLTSSHSSAVGCDQSE